MEEQKIKLYLHFSENKGAILLLNLFWFLVQWQFNVLANIYCPV